MLPPVITPPGFTISPCRVTIRKEYPARRAKTTASSISLTMAVRASKNSTARFASPLARTAWSAIRITSEPSACFSLGFKWLTRSAASGKKVTRPKCSLRKSAMAILASCSPGTTTFCSAPPSTASTAASYCSGTSISSASVPKSAPCMLFSRLAARIKLRTPWEYPSYSAFSPSSMALRLRASFSVALALLSASSSCFSFWRQFPIKTLFSLICPIMAALCSCLFAWAAFCSCNWLQSAACCSFFSLCCARASCVREAKFSSFISRAESSLCFSAVSASRLNWRWRSSSLLRFLRPCLSSCSAFWASASASFASTPRICSKISPCFSCSSSTCPASSSACASPDARSSSKRLSSLSTAIMRSASSFFSPAMRSASAPRPESSSLARAKSCSICSRRPLSSSVSMALLPKPLCSASMAASSSASSSESFCTRFWMRS